MTTPKLKCYVCGKKFFLWNDLNRYYLDKHPKFKIKGRCPERFIPDSLLPPVRVVKPQYKYGIIQNIKVNKAEIYKK